MSVALSIHSNIRDYEVVMEESPEFIATLAAHPQSCFVVDENVWSIYSQSLLNPLPKKDTIVLPISESRKNLDTVQELYDRLVEMQPKRNLTVVSIGGGILQDITGFAASTIYRGVNWIFVPTTLLAQADSCIGSKTSLNYRSFKNLIGTFFPPNRIHIYSPFLQTLADEDFYSGYGEVIKLHLMGGRERYCRLLELSPSFTNRESGAMLEGIRESLNVKLSYMAGDEFDTGRRNLLNYGHDFGHALETTSHFEVPHGQAVIFGMMAANIISNRRGKLDQKTADDIADGLLLPSLITRPSQQALDAEAMIDAMKRDKKRTGDKLALIMMDSEFNFTRVNDLTSDEVSSALSDCRDSLHACSSTQ